tara:strand:+ start:500 stop:880 length:381 start_codon:yes stop_codon:yes gene_type:complete
MSQMTKQSPLVSIRIPEDYLLEIDQLVGLDGMRNRSDVIREAIKSMLQRPTDSVGDSVDVSLGPDLTTKLRDYCKITGEAPDVVLRQSAKEYIKKEIIEVKSVDVLLRERMEELKARFSEDSNDLR